MSLSCLSFIIRLLVFVCHLINLRFRWPRICRYILRIIWLWSLSDSMKIWCEIPITSTRKGAYFFIHVSYLKQFKKIKIVCTFKRLYQTMSWLLRYLCRAIDKLLFSRIYFKYRHFPNVLFRIYLFYIWQLTNR